MLVLLAGKKYPRSGVVNLDEHIYRYFVDLRSLVLLACHEYVSLLGRF